MNKKDEILEKSLFLFSKHGYENVGIQKIVDSVGVTKPTLYHYFGSKKGLLTQLIDLYFDKLGRELKVRASYSGHLLGSLEEFVKVYFRFTENNKAFMSFFLTMINAPKESELFETAYPRIKWLYDFLGSTFFEAVAEHGNLNKKERQLAITFYGMINSYVQMSLHNEMDLKGDAYFLVTKQFMHGIFA